MCIRDSCRVTLASGVELRARSVLVTAHVPVFNLLALHTKIAAYRSYVVAARGAKMPPPGLYFDTADPYHYAEVRGRVVEAIAGQPAADHINKLAAKYIGGPYTFGPTDQRIIYRVEPLRQRARSTGEAPRPTQPTPNGVAPGHGTVVPLDPAIRDMAQAKNFGVLTVIPAGGHPMTHVMWVDADDDCLSGWRCLGGRCTPPL